jgi:hypothetical protein
LRVARDVRIDVFGGFHAGPYRLFELVLERLFLAPGPKIFLQQYRPTTDSCTAASMPDYWDRY